MVVLRKPLLSLAWLFLLAACEFHPDLLKAGYPACQKQSACPRGQLCLEGACLPDCADRKLVVSIEPGEDDSGVWSCPGSGRCETTVDPNRLVADLPVGGSLVLGPAEEGSDPGCRVLLLRFSAVSLLEGRSLKMSMAIQGQDQNGKQVVGVVDEAVLLNPQSGGLQESFDRQVHQYMIDTGAFGWPVSMVLTPQTGTTQANFALRGFSLTCCMEWEEG